MAFTVAGGNGVGFRLDQFDNPCSVHVDDDEQSVIVTDTRNHRVVEWKFGASEGQVVAGGNGPGSELNQLNAPVDAILNAKKDAIIVCDQINGRVVSWSRHDRNSQRVLVPGIVCWGLATVSNGDLYIVDWNSAAVRRWKEGQTSTVLVAGENGKGSNTNQFDQPTYIVVDESGSMYIADKRNGRVMKWMQGAAHGVQVVPVNNSESDPAPFRYLYGLAIDRLGRLYTTAYGRHYVTRWSSDTPEGTWVVGRHESGNAPDQFRHPEGIAFDRHNNLYVVDLGNQRVQKFKFVSW